MKESRKGLGMGLDLLLKASSHEPVNKEQSDLAMARVWYQEALEREDNENLLEAYYYYRKIVDLWIKGIPKDDEEKAKLLSQSLNNAATILFEYGYTDSAREYLEKALWADTGNDTARENLKVILAEE